MDRETSLLMELAERPDDRALRLVFSDWLLEQGDARGEVIALCARGNLSLTEQRRVTRITHQHAAQWLGPLSHIADLHRTRFHEGFLDELVCSPPVSSIPTAAIARFLARENDDVAIFDGLVGDPRLATMRSLSVPPQSEAPSGLMHFLSHRFMSRIDRLELGSIDWRSLQQIPFVHLKPSRVVLASWGAFERELSGLQDVPVFARARSLGLSTTDFTNAPTVRRIVNSVGNQLGAISGFREVQLLSHYGPVEGSADWLVAGDDAASALPELEAWSLEASEVGFTRVRADDRRLSHFVVDLSLPEATVGEKQAVDRGRPPMVMRLHTAVMVMSLMRGRKIRSVEIKLPPGGRLRSQERHTLFAEARRWGTLEHFTIAGETISGSANLP